MNKVNLDSKQLLKLQVKDAEDLSVVSALLQDALVAVEDIGFLNEGYRPARFVLIVSRFCWEEPCLGDAKNSHRRLSSFIIENVRSVSSRSIDRQADGQILNLLTVTQEKENIIVFYFSGGAAIRVEVSGLNCKLLDMAEPWPTKFIPQHTYQN